MLRVVVNGVDTFFFCNTFRLGSLETNQDYDWDILLLKERKMSVLIPCEGNCLVNKKRKWKKMMSQETNIGETEVYFSHYLKQRLVVLHLCTQRQSVLFFLLICCLLIF